MASPRKPNKELTPMMINVVPIANLNGRPANNVSAGRIRNPPPTPTKPTSMPVPRPAGSNSLNLACPSVGELLFRRTVRADVMASETKTVIIRNRFVIRNSPRINDSGIFGTIHVRVQNIAAAEHKPNVIPARVSNRCSFCFTHAPIRLVVPTMNSEYDEAVITSKENRYTKIGMESNDPPPPISDNTMPMKMSEM